MTDRRTSPLTKALAWFFAIALGIAIIAGMSSDPAPRPGPSADDLLAMEACAIAQEAVKAKLKAPSSAKFPGCAFGAHEYRIRADEARDTVWVMGHVDAQNDFGAMLRSDFGVKLERRNGQLVAVQAVLER